MSVKMPRELVMMIRNENKVKRSAVHSLHPGSEMKLGIKDGEHSLLPCSENEMKLENE